MKVKKIDLKRYSFSILSFLLLGISILLLILKVSGSFYFYLFGLGCVLACYVLKNSKAFNLWTIITTSIFWSSALLILFAGLLSIASIQIKEWILFVPIVLIVPLLFISPISLEGLLLKPNVESLLLLSFSLISLVSHVSPIRGYITPILHDPIAHVDWAKQIYETGIIDYFYSPGLHILAALGKMVDGAYISEYILIITNLFNALVFIPVYLFVKDFFKSKKMALVATGIFLFAEYPSAFYWTAGKNSLVMGITIMFLALFVASLDFEKTKKFVVLNILSFVLILTHYPIALIGFVGIFAILFYKGGIKGVYNILLGCLLGLIWGFIKMRHQIAHTLQSVSSTSVVNTFSFTNITTFARDTYLQIISFFDYPGGKVIFFLGLLGLVLMLLKSFKSKKYFFFSIFLYGNILLMLIIEFVEKLSSLGIVYKTQILVFFIFIYIGLAFLISEIIWKYLFKAFKHKTLNYFFYILIIVFALIGLSNKYSIITLKQEALSTVEKDDLKLYEWMDLNLSEETTILNNAIVGNRKKIVYASDGGSWIPVFSNMKILMPFTEFSYQSTHDYYEVYLKILNEDYDCEDINYLLDEGVNYYYQSSKGVFGPQINPGANNPHFKLEQAIGNARLFRIIPCQ